jgi:hypothetical protein
MKDPTDEILTAFYSALNGNLTYSDVNWPVYTSADTDQNYNYVLLDDVFLTNDMTKDAFISEGTILIDIVGGAMGKRGTLKGVNSICNQILLLVIKKDLTLTNFAWEVLPYLDSVNIIKEEQETSIIIRKLLRLRFSIEQI